MDFTLPADLREMQTHIRHFAVNDVEARAHEIERTNAVPPELTRQAAELGLFGLSIPRNTAASGWECWAAAPCTRHWGRGTWALAE